MPYLTDDQLSIVSCRQARSWRNGTRLQRPHGRLAYERQRVLPSIGINQSACVEIEVRVPRPVAADAEVVLRLKSKRRQNAKTA